MRSIYTIAGDPEKGRELLEKASGAEGLNYMETRIDDKVVVIDSADQRTSSWFAKELQTSNLRHTVIQKP